MSGAPWEQARAIAHVVRGGVVESVHHGHVVAVDAGGEVLLSVGAPEAEVFARSSLKPLQAAAMLRSGLRLDGPLLALACASHSGEAHHLEAARAVLASAGLDEDALQNTPDLPLDDAASLEWRSAGRGKASIAQNCSGKHSAMLATCVRVGWDTGTYLEPRHALQQAVRATVAELTGGQAQHTTVDGCGAPLFSSSLTGLARAFGTIAAAAAGHGEDDLARIGRAMNGHPQMVGGTGRDVTTLMAGVPGLVAKDGAEGVYAVGLPDGRGVALKVLDGSQRARPVVMAAVLRVLGRSDAVLDEIGSAPVLGHGIPVGTIEAVLPTAS